MFGKRHWAVRVIDHAGLRASEPVGAELVDLLVSLSKQLASNAKAVGGKLDDATLVIQSALIAGRDSRTASRLVSEAAISRAAAEEYSGLLLRAAEIVAVKYSREAVLESARRAFPSED